LFRWQKAKNLESISPTFYKRICANILVPIKSLTFTASINKKLCAKLSYKKATRKMLVKLTPNRRLLVMIKLKRII
jgi:hypothetical protein